jgi:ankyrin repeat protein
VLLSFNADYRVLDSSQSTLLHYTARGGKGAVEVFEALRTTDRHDEKEKNNILYVDHRLNIDEKKKEIKKDDMDKYDRLSVNNDALLKGLLNMRDVLGNTPLHNACDSKQLDISKALVLFGSDINAQTINTNDIKIDTGSKVTSVNNDSVESFASVSVRRSVGNLKVDVGAVQSSPPLKEVNLITNDTNQLAADSESYKQKNDLIINNLKTKLRKISDPKKNPSPVPSPTPGLPASVWGITPLHIAIKKR